MSTRHQNFRVFLNERFTAIAVAVFEEVETMMEEYYEENRRLRNTLHMALNPVIKLRRMEEDQNAGTAIDVSDQFHRHFKEEQIEHEISCRSEQQKVLEEVQNIIAPECIKKEIEEDDIINVVQVSGSYDDLPAAEDIKKDLSSNSDTSCPQLSESKESTTKCDTGKFNKMLTQKKRCLQRTVLEHPRIMPVQSFSGTPIDFQSFQGRLTEAFKDLPNDQKPLITKMGLSERVELVDSALGKVPKGSVLSYQCPVLPSQDYKTVDDAPPRPVLPLTYHALEPISSVPSLSLQEQKHLKAIEVTWEEAQSLESSTSRRKELIEEQQKLRLTSRFREICKLKPGQSNARHLVYKMQQGPARCKTLQIDEKMKAEALRIYCSNLHINWYPCGLVVHPNAPWLGVQPDGLVYDPSEDCNFGILHIKCIDLCSFTEARFLDVQHGVLKLQKNHTDYWHIQGELMITGASWCDLLVLSHEDVLVQRLYRDCDIMNVMKMKLDEFFFYYYLPSLL
ncbi:uncharacterized protein V6R79_001974 [Siganus canaliculatus]